MRSGSGLSHAWFESEAARRVLPGLALHTDVGPDDMFGSGIGYMLAVMATTGGYGVPEGGAGAITAALVRKLESHGGRVQCNSRVTKIEVRDRRAAGVVLADGALDGDGAAREWGGGDAAAVVDGGPDDGGLRERGAGE